MLELSGATILDVVKGNPILQVCKDGAIEGRQQ
jgi:hypothetical protein